MPKVGGTESDMVIQIVFGILEQGIYSNCIIHSGLTCKKETIQEKMGSASRDMEIQTMLNMLKIHHTKQIENVSISSLEH